MSKTKEERGKTEEGQRVNIFLGADHAAFTVKERLKAYLQLQFEEWEVLKVEERKTGARVRPIDLGTLSNERCAYPQFAIKVAQEVARGGRGILLCGSGVGVSMVANRFAFVRAALCRSSTDAQLSREHNDANVLCLGARVNSWEEIKSITNTWLTTEFSGGRHQERIALFNALGEGEAKGEAKGKARGKGEGPVDQ